MAFLSERGTALRDAYPRIVNVVLGTWLFLSAFAWPHARTQMTNTWVVGVMCATCAIVAMAVPWVHCVNTLLAIWLFVSTWWLPAVDARTVWNNVIVSVAMFAASLVPWTPSAEHPGYLMRRPPPGRIGPADRHGRG
jgi:hypothetical protein